jgi:heme-degrading monooxygenase HmoA
MILERALITVKPGQAEAFKAAFPKARPHIAGAKGFHKCEMRQGIENPEDFLLLVWWETLEDHNVCITKSRSSAASSRSVSGRAVFPPSRARRV